MKKFFLVSCLILCFAHTSFAVTDIFTARLLVGGDTTPPSTPTALVATPVTQTQIDISWGASTDDFILGGYQVFRDAVHIATTTLTSYSDTGLTASTSYSYFVKAFDTAFNFSSSSNVVATTTLALVSTTTPPSGDIHSGSLQHMVLRSFDVSVLEHSAVLSWETSQYAQFELRWGRSTSYELGFVATELFKKNDSTTITELSPSTKYAYQLIAYDRYGRMVVLKTGEFTTKSAPDTSAPTNVSNLKAVAQGNDVYLTWQSPFDDDFAHVRIVRSYLFYPNDTQDGFTTYQDDGTSFLDRDAFLTHDTLYYTLFTFDKNGNISSGAVVSVKKDGTAVSFPKDITMSTSTLRFSDIEFVQDGVVIGTSSISANTPLLLRIAYQKLPEHLKTVTVSFTHPVDGGATFSFLLRINKDKTYYEATIAPLLIVGVFPTSLFVFDYQTRTLQSVHGSITTHNTAGKNFGTYGTTIVTHHTLLSFLTFAFYLFWLLVFIVLLYKLVRWLLLWLERKDF